MASRFALLAILLVGAVGCRDKQDPANPPAPPVDTRLPPALRAALPTTDAGLPILIWTNAGGLEVGLAVDETIDDPSRRRASCMSRVSACYEANPGRKIAGCIDQIEQCKDNTGGLGCCAPACIKEFRALSKQGVDEDEAIDRVFLGAACLEGYRRVTWEEIVGGSE